MKIIKIIVAAMIFTTWMAHDSIDPRQTFAQEEKSSIDYSLWANVLKNYVNEEGLVDYEGLLNDRSRFDQFMALVESADITVLNPTELKAYWINAYNAITMKVILDKYPVKKIILVNFGLVWKKGRKAAQGKYSLEHIEHKILRPLGDPRIHFAINCASIGCPKLPQKPFYPLTLDEQLDHETVRFINDEEKVRIDRDQNIVFHSAIFDWFAEDFLRVAPDILSYIERYIHEADRQYIDENEVRVKAIKYDWNLNKQ